MENEIEEFGDPGIASRDAKIPLFLKWTYVLLPIWGLATFYVFWNGSVGWMDRGYWHELQIAANTTFPIENQNDPQDIPTEESRFINGSDYLNESNFSGMGRGTGTKS